LPLRRRFSGTHLDLIVLRTPQRIFGVQYSLPLLDLVRGDALRGGSLRRLGLGLGQSQISERCLKVRACSLQISRGVTWTELNQDLTLLDGLTNLDLHVLDKAAPRIHDRHLRRRDHCPVKLQGFDDGIPFYRHLARARGTQLAGRRGCIGGHSRGWNRLSHSGRIGLLEAPNPQRAS